MTACFASGWYLKTLCAIVETRWTQLLDWPLVHWNYWASDGNRWDSMCWKFDRIAYIGQWSHAQVRGYRRLTAVSATQCSWWVPSTPWWTRRFCGPCCCWRGDVVVELELFMVRSRWGQWGRPGKNRTASPTRTTTMNLEKLVWSIRCVPYDAN